MMKGMKEIFQELEQEGYVKIKDRDYGLSIKRLDEQMAKEIKECEFTNSKYKLGEDNSENLETYINTLYDMKLMMNVRQEFINLCLLYLEYMNF